MSFWKLNKFFPSNCEVYCLKCLIDNYWFGIIDLFISINFGFEATNTNCWYRLVETTIGQLYNKICPIPILIYRCIVKLTLNKSLQGN
jgi:hypothetical protein